MLHISAGGDVCRVLKRSSDGRMQPPVRYPHKRAVVNTLLPQFSDFISVMRQFRMPPVQHLRELPLQWKRPHVQGRTASGTAAVVRISDVLEDPLMFKPLNG